MSKRARKQAPPKARAESMAETREALIHAAIVCFGEQGLDASLDSICERAGFTRGAFYVHFASREELIAAVIEKTSAWTATMMLGAAGDLLDLPQVIAFFGEAVASGQYPPKMGAVRLHHLLDAYARSPTMRARHLEHLDRVRAQLAGAARAGQQTKDLRSDVPAVTMAELLLALVMGTEMMLTLGFSFDVRAGAAAVGKMLSASRPS
jgi:TetR/AcrR family transcriptional regulator, transcriptional repressor for nem operon